MHMNWTLVGFTLSCVAGAAFVGWISYLNHRENVKRKDLMRQMDEIGKQRFVLDGNYTEKEKGF